MGDGSQEPGYVSVMTELQALIADLPPDTQIPSIRATAAERGLEVGVVRGAYEKLRDQGLLISRHGKGWFTVAPRPLEPDEVSAIMQRFDDLSEEMRKLGERVAQLEARQQTRGAQLAGSERQTQRRSRPAAP